MVRILPALLDSPNDEQRYRTDKRTAGGRGVEGGLRPLSLTISVYRAEISTSLFR